MTVAVGLDELRAIDLFDDLDDGDLAQWRDSGTIVEPAAATTLIEQGAPSPGFHLVLAGTVRAFQIDGDRAEPLGTHVAPTWIGAIPTLTEMPYSVRMVCETDCRLLHIPVEDFERLVWTQRPVRRRILRQFGPVISRITALEHNRERLAALGTMAAGLAHELNNPAAAAKRAAADLADALGVIGSVMATFVESGVERDQAEQLVALQQRALDAVCRLDPLGALDAADAEDELLDQLDRLAVPNAHRLAEPLAAAGVDGAFVDEVAALAGPATAAALDWIAASVTARSLAEDLREAAGRMSSLVAAVKTYAYMDRGERVEVDLHEGLETTLIVLGHKLKHTAIEVRRDYDRALPRATVLGSELNQVWTNLIDNAIDALGERGTITITTRRDGSCAEILIADDGPGMPGDVLAHAFDPFFTTKGVGAGTGLGLDTARRIVVDRHRGSLTAASRPGATTFAVRLPLDG